MGVFLPSETGRLVLSYLLDQGYEETRERFMSECGAIAELRDLDREDLEFACKVNNRSLTELLKEYNRSLLHTITTVFNFTAFAAWEIKSESLLEMCPQIRTKTCILNSLSEFSKQLRRSGNLIKVLLRRMLLLMQEWHQHRQKVLQHLPRFLKPLLTFEISIFHCQKLLRM